MQINELQKWVADDWERYPKNKPDLAQQILLVIEELGEVAEAIRKTDRRKDRVEKELSVGSEMADLVISIITLANTYEIDLTKEIENFKSRLAKRQNQGF
jgi:NTP pyrophosphatase (non-canonical NTP hydrolase)